MSGNAATIIPAVEHLAKLQSSELVATLMQNDQRMAVHGIDGLVGGGGLENLNSLALAINGIKGVHTSIDEDNQCTCNRSTLGKRLTLLIHCKDLWKTLTKDLNIVSLIIV